MQFKMKINDLIFRELAKRRYYIENKTRVWDLADTKLWYLTPEQSQGFLDLENNAKYKRTITDNEIQLVKKHLPPIIKKLKDKSYNVIDLGCGNGRKAIEIIKEFRKKFKVRYCPIDISSYMVSKAADTVRALNLGEVVELKWNISDFENLTNITPLLRENEFQNHFMMLLGNTLGNFDRDDILYEIKESMITGDYLLIGNSLNTLNVNEIVEPYKSPLLDDFLVKVVEQIGLNRNDIEYDARFNNSRIEMFYRVKSKLSVRHLNKKVTFKLGDIILVAISYRFGEKDFSSYLRRFFKDVSIFNDRDYAIALCCRT